MNFVFRDSKHAESLKRDLWNGQKSQIRPRRDGNRSETRISQLRELRVNCSARFRVRFSTPFKQDRPFIVRPLILLPPPSRSRDCRFLANHAASVKVLTIHVFFISANLVGYFCLSCMRDMHASVFFKLFVYLFIKFLPVIVNFFIF